VERESITQDCREQNPGVENRACDLRDVRGYNGGDIRKRVVETTGEEFHSGNGTKRDECNDQSVFHQVLTLFALQKRLKQQTQFDIETGNGDGALKAYRSWSNG
jgi:hypothetical protein